MAKFCFSDIPFFYSWETYDLWLTLGTWSSLVVFHIQNTLESKTFGRKSFWKTNSDKKLSDAFLLISDKYFFHDTTMVKLTGYIKSIQQKRKAKKRIRKLTIGKFMGPFIHFYFHQNFAMSEVNFNASIQLVKTAHGLFNKILQLVLT